jgi:hypothetical protein
MRPTAPGGDPPPGDACNIDPKAAGPAVSPRGAMRP